MALIYCGIDEAGYGPLLGPLCVGCSMFRIENWSEGDAAPDLWELLGSAVCREASDKQRRIAVDDSKKLKLANSSVRKHPLHHLERGVLAFGAGRLGLNGEPCEVATDLAFLASVGVRTAPERWYGGDAFPFPAGVTAGEVAIATSRLRAAFTSAGVGVLAMRAEAVSESVFNEIAEASGTKAAVTESVIVRYLAEVWEVSAPLAADGVSGVRVVCDRLGGRTQYGAMLARAFPEAQVVVVVETPTQSKYEVRSQSGGDVGRRMSVLFKTEAESAHLPVALASMLAKLTRELLMARFNKYWSARVPELKPTAGYALDARRWLRDVQQSIDASERRALVRRA